MNLKSTQAYEMQLKWLLKNMQVIQCVITSKAAAANISEIQQTQNLSSVLFMMMNWLSILNNRERTTITLHLCYHNTWAEVAREYKQIMGKDESRTERTLRSYQKQGLSKIIRCFAVQISIAQNILPNSCLIYH